MQSSVCSILLKHQAFVINETNPFTWSSGLEMPFYCDNRVLLSFPESRDLIVDELCQMIKPYLTKNTALVGVATAGIPWASFLAMNFGLPLSYVRPAPKTHGKTKAIEGELHSSHEILVIEDLISTGKSSAQAIHQLRELGHNPKHLFALFSYGFKSARQLFDELNVKYTTLSTFQHLQEELLSPIKLTREQQELFS